MPGQSYTAGVSATYTTGESEISTIEFDVPLITGIDNNANPNISIFPNPSNGDFIVNTNSNYTLEIMDITGKIVFEEKLTQAQTKVNLSSQEAGLYFVRFTNDFESINLKIIIE